MRYFTSESVTEGHPDKVADRISDSVLDAVLAEDSMGRVACETMVTTNRVIVAGETSSNAGLGRDDVENIARGAIRDIGYVETGVGFDADSAEVSVIMDRQSPDISAGVSSSVEVRGGSVDPMDELGAGDQGLMFGYANRDTDALMPLPIQLAHRLAEELSAVRKRGTLEYLRPDGKTQVTVAYDGMTPVHVERILISTQHAPGVTVSQLDEDLWKHVVQPVMESHELNPDAEWIVNPSGKFEVGGPQADAGLTGRKIIVDTYGGYARHGGGAFSGKDPTKVDRSAAYAARYVAKNVVASGLADICEIQVSYAIGLARPFSVLVEAFGTARIAEDRLSEIVLATFDLRPQAIIDRLGLRRPIYAATSAYGHFGRDEFPK
ncbi:MAG: methionine adenosyltransferase [Acidimicrobiia bacterium]|nr:methionine adenosyltransferase [Acidimicrobiia bacterium]